ncbi:MAG: hypothetical protein V7636_443 [Actinomycetota bacterium]
MVHVTTTTIDLQAAKQRLDEDGYVLVPDALSADQLAAVRERLVGQAELERREGWAATYGESQGVLNLLAKGPEFSELALHRPVLDLIEHLLGKDVLLSSITAHILGPGNERQMIHADQAMVPAPWPAVWVANVAWILDDFTADNGATLIVPGSHTAGTNPAPGEIDKSVPVVGPAGSAMVFDGRLWHAAGKNETDAKRHAIFAYYCAPFLRQQENTYLSLDRDFVKAAPDELRKLLGYVPLYGKLGIIPR